MFIQKSEGDEESAWDDPVFSHLMKDIIEVDMDETELRSITCNLKATRRKSKSYFMKKKTM